MKGQNQYQRFKNGEPLTFKQAILAQCYVCNGEAEGGEDCLGVGCPLYQYMPYRKGRQKKQSTLTQEERNKIGERLRKGRVAVSLSPEA